MTGEVKLTNVIPGQSDMEKLTGGNVCLHPWRTQDTVLLCDIIPSLLIQMLEGPSLANALLD